MITYNMNNMNSNMGFQNNDHYQNNDLSNNSIVNIEQQANYELQLEQIEKFVQEKENQIQVLRNKSQMFKYEKESIKENIKALLHSSKLRKIHHDIYILDNTIQTLEQDAKLCKENKKNNIMLLLELYQKNKEKKDKMQRIEDMDNILEKKLQEEDFIMQEQYMAYKELKCIQKERRNMIVKKNYIIQKINKNLEYKTKEERT